MQQGQVTPTYPPLIVIFGITGDLAQRYLLPALYQLFKSGQLDEKAQIIGITRQDLTAEQLFERVDVCVHEVDKTCDPDVLAQLHRQTRLIQMDPTDTLAYTALLRVLNDIEAEKGVCMNRLYYLSIPPQLYRPIIKHMGEAGLNGSCQHDIATTRLLVEKPFGYDLLSAKELISETDAIFREDQIFRIDHFLAKEPVQHILEFRTQNPQLESLWNRQLIKSVEICASETIGIEGRAHFYDSVGALRDFIQNHLLQLLAIIAMRPPLSGEGDALHFAKQALLEKVIPMPADQVISRAIRGQYLGYNQEVANTGSTTETYADLTLYIDEERWRDVPFRLWTGKVLAEKKYEIIIKLDGGNALNNNQLHLRIQPDESIELEILSPATKIPEELQEAVSKFADRHYTGVISQAQAYAKVIYDAAMGDHRIFVTSDEVLASWRIVQPALDQWAKSGQDLIIYKPSTSGPLEAKAGD